MENKKNAKALEILNAVVSDVTVTDSRTGATVTKGKQHKLTAADFDSKAEFDGYKRIALALSEDVRKYACADANDPKAYSAARTKAKKALATAVEIVCNTVDASPKRAEGGNIIVPAAMLEYIAQRATTAKATAGEKSLQRVAVSPATFRGIFEDAICKLINGLPFADVAQNASAAKDFANIAAADAKAAEKERKESERRTKAAEKAADIAAAQRAKNCREKPAIAAKAAAATPAA